jgi:hypothetical protein
MVDRRDQRLKKGNNEMKKRKSNVDRNEDTKGMPRKEQVAISRLPKLEGVSNQLCPFCTTHLSVDHILWECKETEDQENKRGHEKRTMEQREKRYGKDN